MSGSIDAANSFYSIRLIIVRRAEAARLEPDAWGAHSLRRGFATEAIARGVPERDVQCHGRWRCRARPSWWLFVSPP